MNTVSIYNYEAVLLDFTEGRLSSAETNALFDFLAAHPELQDDFDAALAMTTLEEDVSIGFSKKNALLKDDATDALQNLIIASVEGVANPSEERALESMLQANPKLAQEIRVFEHMKLEADETLTFAGKNKLIQPVVVPISTWIFRTTFAAAAVWLLFIIFNQNVGIQESDTLAKWQLKPLSLGDKVQSDLTQDVFQVAENFTKSSAPQVVQPQNTLNKSTSGNSIRIELAENREFFQNLNPRVASSLDMADESALAHVNPEEFIPQSGKEKYVTSFLEELAAQSTRVQATYGFAEDLAGKVKSLAEDFRTYDELEIKIWGMHTTIRKPSWMKWRRSIDKL